MAAAPAVKFTINEVVLYPEGKHLFQIVDYKPATGQYGPQVVWSLELTDFEREDGKPPRINYYTSTAISLKSKLGKLFLACRIPLPQDADEAAAMNPNDLIGKQLYGTIVHKMGSDGATYSNIADDSLLSVPKTKTAPTSVSSQASPAAQPKLPAAPVPADETLPRMKLRKAWDLLTKKAAVVEFSLGEFPADKTDADIAEEIAAHKKVIAALEEEAENEPVDPFQAE